MINKIVFFIVVICIVASCSQQGVTENVYGENVALDVEELPIKINENTLQEYTLLSSYKTEEGMDAIVGYNDLTHSLDVIDLDKDQIVNIPLLKEGDKATPLGITGLYAHRKDSIWLYNDGYIYLLNEVGEAKTTIPVNIDDPIIVNTNYSMGCVKLYFNQIRRSLLYASKSFVYEYFVDNDSIIKHQLEVSSFLKDKEVTLYGWKQTPNISYTDEAILYNYPIASDLYRIDLKTGQKHLFGGKSRYTNNVSNTLSAAFTFENAERHKVQNIHFFELLHNKKYNVYFRLHVGEHDGTSNDDLFASYNQKKMYVMTFDKDFNVINETELGSNKYSYINSWVSADRGLILFNK